MCENECAHTSGPLTYFDSPIEQYPYRRLTLAQTIAMLGGHEVFIQLFRSEIQSFLSTFKVYNKTFLVITKSEH